MTSLESRFRKWHKIHANPFTPEILEIKTVNDKVIELSTNRAKDYFGVAVWEDTGRECDSCGDYRPEHNRFTSPSHELSKPFRNKTEARMYAGLLHRKFQHHNEIENIVHDVVDR